MSHNALTRAESLTLALRQMFEQRGYRRYRMSHFESYDLYRENKSFLKSEGILTFTDTAGRLMALKPDVTMSIIKNTKPEEVSSKLYYNESVFRTALHSTEYREISQMGVEYIGANTSYAEAEVVLLALRSLAAIGGEAVLNLSHMGFITGYFNACGLPEDARSQALAALRGKNAHTLQSVALQAGCTQENAARLAALTGLSGALNPTLAQARAMCVAPEMEAAVAELQALQEALSGIGYDETSCSLRLDFSGASDNDYYNGILFQGYVLGVPHAVLAGGRYDNLMRRFAKPQQAMGFGVYLGDLGRLLAEPHTYDADVLLLYSEADTPRHVLCAVETLAKTGASVRAECTPQPQLHYKRTLRLLPDGSTEEVASC